MRALVQRVSRASVSVEGSEVSAIGPGLLVLLGVGRADSESDADWLADKVRALRIFPDEHGRMNEPLGEREVLCVSQFTLYGDARRGNRPAYLLCPARQSIDLSSRATARLQDDIAQSSGEWPPLPPASRHFWWYCRWVLFGE